MNSYLSCEGVMASGPRCRYFDKDWLILSGSLMSEISDKVMKLKGKVVDKIFWNKNGSVSLGHFLAFQCFLLSSTDSLEVSSFLSAFSKAGQMVGIPGGRRGVFVAAAVSVSGQSTFTSIILF